MIKTYLLQNGKSTGGYRFSSVIGNYNSYLKYIS